MGRGERICHSRVVRKVKLSSITGHAFCRVMDVIAESGRRP